MPDTSPVDTDYRADLDRLADGTAVLLAALAGLTDAQVPEPSRLPGWTRGHVLTHLARNADGMLHLVDWARTGHQTPMYPSRQVREDDIAAGAGRDAAALVADVRQSARRLQEGLLGLAGTDGPAADVVLGVPGPASHPVPAAMLPFHRRCEVEVHHADLGLGYGPTDWPPDFATRLATTRAAARAGAEGLAGIALLAADEGPLWQLAVPEVRGVTLAGPTAWLAAWLMGREVPPGRLRTSDGSPVPPAPAL